MAVNGIQSLEETLNAATTMFRTFEEGDPELIPTGIEGVDSTIGGLAPGTLGVLGASTKVGKSSVALTACFSNQLKGVRTGYLSLEDAGDVVGCRLLARYSGVNALDIRTKSFDPGDEKKLREASEAIAKDAALETSVVFGYSIGQGLTAVADRMSALADMGCKMIWVDYLQKVKNVHEERRIGIGRILGELQRVAAEKGVAVMLVSQVTRTVQKGKIPPISTLKEAGEIENEARLIVMTARRGAEVIGRISASSYGGAGKPLFWYNDTSGTLIETNGPKDEEEEDDF